MRIKLILALLAMLAISATGVLFWLLRDLPPLDSLQARLAQPSVRILDREGRLLYEALPAEGGRHTVVPLDQVALALQQATIATEDAHFYTNPGVDLGGILRAVWINLRGGETIAGGSTLTQQVARNLLLTETERQERSLRRKLRESFLAWQLSRRLSKDEILALYLNQTYYGGLSYGVEAAAQTYFGKPSSQLDLAESALLAGLPQAPALYNPFTDFEAARQRQQVVLGLMLQDGYITAQEHDLAVREPLVLASTPYPIQAPHFVMYVRALLDSLFTPQQIYASGGLVVRTTLNLDWQLIAERAVAQQLEALRRSPDGLGHNVSSAALVALDPHTGEILTMLGSADYFDAAIAGAVNMVIFPRQPGSAIKPLTYAAALDPARPAPWTAATMILDVTTSFVTQDGSAYIPKNYDGLEHGPVLVRQALASSLNIPAVITLQHIGVDALLAQAASQGITTLQRPQGLDLPLALGAGDVSLVELTAAYGAFANGGYRLVPSAILEVTDAQGQQLYAPTRPPLTRVMDERVAWLISDILSDDSARVLGFGSGSILNIGRPAAVKTGTTTNFHDNWTVGYTPDLVVGVWAGNTDQSPMRDVTGLTGAAPIWHSFMRAMLENTPETQFIRPAGLVQVEVCALSGLLPTDACPYQRREWFIQGTQPTQMDNIYQRVEIDTRTGYPPTPDTPPEDRRLVFALDLPPQAETWAHSQGLILLADLMSTMPPRPSGDAAVSGLAMLSPAPSSIYQLTTRLPAGSQRILVQAAVPSGFSQVTVWLDGISIASLASPPYQTWWILQAGSHQVWVEAVDQAGNTVTSQPVSFQVLP